MKKNKPSETPPSEIPDELSHLPRDVGWILLISGLLSELGIPGVPPFWIGGIMILWPKTGIRMTRPIQKRFPEAFARSMQMLSKYADDLDRRYPKRASKKDSHSSSRS
jgi:hypothetical protein